MVTSDTFPGRRTTAHAHDAGKLGDYWPATSEQWAGFWTVVLPNGAMTMINPSKHRVVEHEDETISVTPSLLYEVDLDGKRQVIWHGWLERGVFRSE